MITVRMVKYSDPPYLIGLRVRVSLRASQLVVFDGRTVVATHPRVAARTGHRVVLDHYLKCCATNPARPARVDRTGPSSRRRSLHLRPCAAIVDRITYHGTIIETGTHSYRLAHARSQHG